MVEAHLLMRLRPNFLIPEVMALGHFDLLTVCFCVVAMILGKSYDSGKCQFFNFWPFF